MAKFNGKSRWMFLMVLVAGIAFSVLMNKNRAPMQHSPEERQAYKVTTVIAKEQTVRPSITGFGEVEPDVLLESKSEVSGKIAYLHPQLREGFILPKGTVVVRIESQDYLLALKQAEADLVVSRANLKQMELSLKDTEIRYQLAQENLDISLAELSRNEKLHKKGSVSASLLEAKKSSVIQLKQEVQNLSNQLETLPAQREVQAAQIVISEASVETQQRNLERTEIKLPFDARISSLSVEESQFVSQGTSLFSAQTIDRVVINARFPLDQFQILSRGFKGGRGLLDEMIKSGQTDRLFSSLGLSAKVRLAAAENSSEWLGTVERISGNLDPSSRTLGVIISVENPYQNIEPGVRPPLIQGMYLEVTLQGNSRSAIVLPRDAMHGNQLFTVDSEKKLHRVDVSVEAQGEMLLLDKGITPGVPVITSDLFPAVEGMLLDVVNDERAERHISQWVEAAQ